MPEKTFTTHDIARFCDVYPSSVNQWIKAGDIRAYSTPGGHQRVTREDLVSFLTAHRIPLPKELKDEKKRVLIVDDEPELTKVLQQAFDLHPARFASDVRYDGVSALVRVGEEHPALIILDILMPEMNGFQVCDLLKASPTTRDIKIIAVSGGKPVPTPEALAAHKIDAFFPKPFELDDVVAKAAALLGVDLEPA